MNRSISCYETRQGFATDACNHDSCDKRTILLGIAGAALGGYLSSLLFGWDMSSFSLAGLAVAVVGALLLLFNDHWLMAARREV
jgi:hypothetical protein